MDKGFSCGNGKGHDSCHLANEDVQSTSPVLAHTNNPLVANKRGGSSLSAPTVVETMEADKFDGLKPPRILLAEPVMGASKDKD